MLPNFAYIRARSTREAVNHMAGQGAALHAGGTDLLGCLRDGVFDARTVVSISGLNALKGIKETAEGGVRIGSLSTITEVAENPIIQNRFTALSRAAAEVASPQLRNQGTIGGNLCQKPRCWYYRGEFHCLRKGGDRCFAVGGENQFHCIFGGDGCYIVHPSDTAPALVALGASVRVVGRRGTRMIPVVDLHVRPALNVRRETVLDPDEIITEIILPPVPWGAWSAYRKVRARRAWDFALAGMALYLEFKDHVVENARVVFSGVAPVPWRSKEVEGIIAGNTINGTVAEKAAAAAVRDADPMGKNAYKIRLLSGVVETELLTAVRSCQRRD